MLGFESLAQRLAVQAVDSQVVSLGDGADAHLGSATEQFRVGLCRIAQCADSSPHESRSVLVFAASALSEALERPKREAFGAKASPAVSAESSSIVRMHAAL